MSNGPGALVTLHTRRGNMSLALPCLAAALSAAGRPVPRIVEAVVGEGPTVKTALLSGERPSWVGFSCYPWNVDEHGALARGLREGGFEGPLLFGGPESRRVAERHLPGLGAGAHAVHGEGEEALPALLDRIQEGRGETQIEAAPCRLDGLPSPFAAGLVSLERPFVYYEASRGCPFGCEYCTYGGSGGIRSFPETRILDDLDRLVASPVENVIFVDRSFNLNPALGEAILGHLLRRGRGMRFQFEVYPEHLSDEMLRLLGEAPPGMFCLEVGIQTTGRDGLDAVRRRGDFERAVERLSPFLRGRAVRVHADMIVGLPGEGRRRALTSLGDILAVAPHSMQINTLKLLPGTPLRERAAAIGLEHESTPPYGILRAPWLGEEELEELRLVRRLVYLYHNEPFFQPLVRAAAGWVFSDGGALFAAMARRWRREGLPTWGRSRDFWIETLAAFLGDLEPVGREALLEMLRMAVLAGTKTGQSLPRFLYPEGRREAWSRAGARRPRGNGLRLTWGMRVERIRHGWFDLPLAGSRWGPAVAPEPRERFVLLRVETDRGRPPGVERVDGDEAFAAALWRMIDGGEGEGGTVDRARSLGILV